MKVEQVDKLILEKIDNCKTLYWSRESGNFVNKFTGQPFSEYMESLPNFSGSIREWYETLIETCLDAIEGFADNSYERDFVYMFVTRDINTICESTILYKPEMRSYRSFNRSHEVMGTVNNRPAFKMIYHVGIPRNKILLCNSTFDEFAQVEIIDMDPENF